MRSRARASHLEVAATTEATSAPLPSEALRRHREAIRAVVAAHCTHSPRVFGSALHRDDAPGSDLDLLVEAGEGFTLFDLGAIRHELGELLGVPVDVLTPGFLPERVRERVLAEAETV